MIFKQNVQRFCKFRIDPVRLSVSYVRKPITKLFRRLLEVRPKIAVIRRWVTGLRPISRTHS